MCWRGNTTCYRPFPSTRARMKWLRAWEAVFLLRKLPSSHIQLDIPSRLPWTPSLPCTRQYGLTVDNVESITVRLPRDGAGVVNNRSMPDVNCQHMVAVALIDGEVTFESTHAYERMSDPATLEIKERVTLIPDEGLMDRAAPRSGKVSAVLTDGRTVEHFTPHAYGTKENPMSTEDVNSKTHLLLTPVLGKARTEAIIDQVNNIEQLVDVRQLMPLLTVSAEEMANVTQAH